MISLTTETFLLSIGETSQVRYHGQSEDSIESRLLGIKPVYAFEQDRPLLSLGHRDG